LYIRTPHVAMIQFSGAGIAYPSSGILVAQHHP